MIDVVMFAEDQGHELIVGAIVRRVAADQGRPVRVRPRSVRGGYGRVIANLQEYAREVGRKQQSLPDLLVVAVDANSRGIAERTRAIREAVGPLGDRLVCTIPDPHVERWLLVDGHAFKAAVGRGCPAPDLRGDRDRYKELLIRAIMDAGRRPLLGGLEYAAAIVRAIDFDAARQADESWAGLSASSSRNSVGRETDGVPASPC